MISQAVNLTIIEPLKAVHPNKQTHKDTVTETDHFQDNNLSSMLHLFPVDTYWQCHCSLLFEVIGG